MQVSALRTRVFVADDDPGVLSLVRTRLELAGYDTCGARNGREAVTAIRDFKPAALVLDINMPELDGFGVLRALNAFADTKILPALMLTARHCAQDVQTAMALGAKDFLGKPFSDADLVTRVARLLRRRPAPPPTGEKVYL